MLRKTLVLTTLVLFSLTAPRVAFADLMSSVDALFEYLQKTPKPEPKEVSTLMTNLEKEASALLSASTTTPELRKQTFQVLIGCYALVTGVDPTYESKLKATTKDIVKEYPSEDIAAYAEALVFSKEMGRMDASAFLKGLEEYAKTYATFPYGQQLAIGYATYLKVVKGIKEATDLLTEALVIYPKDATLQAKLTLFSMIGTDAVLTGTTLDGKAFDIKDWKGKVVVIDFWATWCKPCRALTPSLIDLYSRKNGEGLEMVGVSFDTDQTKLSDYVKNEAIAWPQILPATAKERDLMWNGFGLTGIPSLFIVGKDGKYAEVDLYDFATIEKVVSAELAK